MYFLSKKYLLNLIDFVCQIAFIQQFNNTGPPESLRNDVLFVLESVTWVAYLREWRTSICLRGWCVCVSGVLDWVAWAVCLRGWRASANGVSVEALT